MACRKNHVASRALYLGRLAASRRFGQSPWRMTLAKTRSVVRASAKRPMTSRQPRRAIKVSRPQFRMKPVAKWGRPAASDGTACQPASSARSQCSGALLVAPQNCAVARARSRTARPEPPQCPPRAQAPEPCRTASLAALQSMQTTRSKWKGARPRGSCAIREAALSSQPLTRASRGMSASRAARYPSSQSPPRTFSTIGQSCRSARDLRAWSRAPHTPMRPQYTRGPWPGTS
mmetsp:Transcript_49396/g.153354  ORF Transcript_49396/g.153354 Transcript_49396/m.153354 type:complete len:233 (+) Transcript_49396:1175-1873(+)